MLRFSWLFFLNHALHYIECTNYYRAITVHFWSQNTANFPLPSSRLGVDPRALHMLDNLPLQDIPSHCFITFYFETELSVLLAYWYLRYVVNCCKCIVRVRQPHGIYYGQRKWNVDSVRRAIGTCLIWALLFVLESCKGKGHSKHFCFPSLWKLKRLAYSFIGKLKRDQNSKKNVRIFTPLAPVF